MLSQDILNDCYDGVSSLDLSDRKITDEEVVNVLIPFLKQHPSITMLNLHHNKVRGVGLKALANITTLLSLNLTDNKISDEGAIYIATTQSIIDLDLSSNLINEGVETLAQNNSILKLNLTSNEVDGEYAVAFARNSCLEELNLTSNAITDKALIAVAKENKSLKILNVSNNEENITDAGVMAFQSNNTIESLNFEDTCVGNDGFIALADMTKLRHLNVSNTLVDDKGLIEFARKNQTVRELYISKDEVGDEAAQAIANMESLKTVKVYQTNITPKGIQYLQEKNPTQRAKSSGLVGGNNKTPSLRRLSLFAITQYLAPQEFAAVIGNITHFQDDLDCINRTVILTS